MSPIKIHTAYTRENSEKLFHRIHWQPYSLTTFEQARKENKPIFLVISAPAWCHWCHVYESEDFLFNEQLYPYINDAMISIFVDSDKRPDLTRKYLEGGWPSTTLLSPDNKRITGFSGPHDPHALRHLCEDAVSYVKTTWQPHEEKHHIDSLPVIIPSREELCLVEKKFLAFLQDSFDQTYGGFLLSEQKFPTGLTYKYLLEKYEETNNKTFLDMVKITFDNQYTAHTGLKTNYKLFDPIEGGFHRYGTRQDWSVPHYEKLLQDQATLIRAYAHLLNITPDENVRTVVMKSINFVCKKFLDNEGGFYSSQDAYLEDHYFSLDKDERNTLPPPFIDKTIKIDATAQMINTFLYLYKTLNKPLYKDIAEKSLAFLQKKMVSAEGAHYYYDTQPHLTGLSLANAGALLVFIDAYETIADKKYLETAQKLAAYSLQNLYDQTSGGFFERNSKEIENYAPQDAQDTTKVYAENSVFAYCFLKLHLITKTQPYLDTALKTLGCLQNSTITGLDDHYYILKTIQLLLKEKLK